MRHLTAGVAILLTSTALLTADPQQQPATTTSIAYDDFVRLTPEERRQAFSDATPETRSVLAETHATRWLAANRDRLTADQIALVEEVIAFIDADLYRRPDDPDIKAKFDSLVSRLECRMRHSDIMTAFKPTRNPTEMTWLEDMSRWFSSCLFGRNGSVEEAR